MTSQPSEGEGVYTRPEQVVLTREQAAELRRDPEKLAAWFRANYPGASAVFDLIEDQQPDAEQGAQSVQPVDREGGLLLVEHHPHDCASPCSVHDLTHVDVVRRALRLERENAALHARLARAEARMEKAKADLDVIADKVGNLPVPWPLRREIVHEIEMVRLDGLDLDQEQQQAARQGEG